MIDTTSRRGRTRSVDRPSSVVGHTPKKGGRAATNAIGSAIVFVCLLLPLVLWQLAAVAEQAEIRRYIQTIGAPPSDSSLAGSMLEGHEYYFISGCVSSPVDCGKSNFTSWGDYYAELGKLYADAVAARGGPGSSADRPFSEWADEHVHYFNTQTAVEGAHELAARFRKNKTATQIHTLGTSVGGSTIIAHLAQAMRGDITLDPRLRDGLMVDAPLGFQLPFTYADITYGLQAGFMKSDVPDQLGEWAKLSGIQLLAIDTPYDIVGHDPVPHIADDAQPLYAQPDLPAVPRVDPECVDIVCRTRQFLDGFAARNVWHNYTGNHMSESAKDFMWEHWR